MFVEPSPDQGALIAAGVAAADEAIRRASGRSFLPTDEVIDWLLDIRQTLDSRNPVTT